jgi:hypothetical protein
MKLWRRRRPDPSERPPDPASDRQVWLRDPKPTDALIPQSLEPDPTAVEPGKDGKDGKDKVYADEIDPAWADPDTAD